MVASCAQCAAPRLPSTATRKNRPPNPPPPPPHTQPRPPRPRRSTLELVAAPEPRSVAQNGAALPRSATAGVPGTWARVGGATVVTLGPSRVEADEAVAVCF